MAYTPTVWKNGEFPPIDAEHLNKIEQGIANSAPGGFGLGGNIVYAPSNSDGASDANLIDATGFYLATANVGVSGWNYVFHMQYPSNDALQFGSFVNDTTYQFRKKISGVWTPWEWVNPPMQLGTEYRTTERYLGKPVYVKAVDCGEITDGKEIDTGISWALKVDVISTQSGYSNPLPRVPFRTTAGSLNALGAAFYVNLHTIIFVCGPSGAGGQAIAIIRYTKTTD